MPTAVRSERDLCRLLEALSNETRLQVVRLVAKAGTLSCRELLTRFPLSQPTMSHHLSLLVRASILKEYREGQRCHYSVDHECLGRSGLNILG